MRLLQPPGLSSCASPHLDFFSPLRYTLQEGPFPSMPGDLAFLKQHWTSGNFATVSRRLKTKAMSG